MKKNTEDKKLIIIDSDQMIKELQDYIDNRYGTLTNAAHQWGYTAQQINAMIKKRSPTTEEISLLVNAWHREKIPAQYRFYKYV